MEDIIETSNLIKDLNFHQDEIIRIRKKINDKIREYLEGTGENFQNKVDLVSREYSGVVVTIEFDDYKFYYNDGTLTYESTSDKHINDVQRLVYLIQEVSHSFLTLEYEVGKQ